MSLAAAFSDLVYDHHHHQGGIDDRLSGYGHHGAYNEVKDCCELVVDPLTFAALMAAILGGTAFLNTLITMNLGRRKRRRRRRSSSSSMMGDLLNSGIARRNSIS